MFIYLKNICIIKSFWIKTGFTLAEILVTLGIIGVIASMTIPNLVQDIQDAQEDRFLNNPDCSAVQLRNNQTRSSY